MSLLKLLGIDKYTTRLKEWVNSQIDKKHAEFVGAAPEQLNTINELAAALGNDENFASTVTNELSKKINEEDVVFEKGESDNSAVLKGGNNIATHILSNATGLNNASVGPYSSSEGYASKSILEYYNIDDIKYSNEKEDEIRDILYQKHIELKEEDPTGDKLFSVAWNLGSHVEGRNGLSLGERAHVEGLDNIGYGHNSHAEGQGNEAKGNNSHVEGYSNVSAGRNSHAEGSHNRAVGENSHAEGSYIISSGKASHAEGLGTQDYDYGAFGNYSHHEGGYNIVNGSYSHGEGANNKTEGTAAHVEGRYNTAKGNFSHAEGRNTIALNANEHAQGMYNKSNNGSSASKKTIHSVGIGSAGTEEEPDKNRKNAHEIMQDGKHYILGIGDYDGTNPNNAYDLATYLAKLETRIKELEDTINILTQNSKLDSATLDNLQLV